MLSRPMTIPEYIEITLKALHTEDPEAAKFYLAEAIRKLPYLIPAYLFRAEVSEKLAKTETDQATKQSYLKDVITDCTNAITICLEFPSSPFHCAILYTACMKMAIAYRKQGNTEQYTSSAEAAKMNYDVFKDDEASFKSRLKLVRDDDNQTYISNKELIQPNDKLMHLHYLAYSALNADSLNMGLCFYSYALDENKDEYAIYASRGYLHYSQKNYDLGLEDCNKSLSLCPNFRGHWARGHIYLEQKKFDLAKSDFILGLQLAIQHDLIIQPTPIQDKIIALINEEKTVIPNDIKDLNSSLSFIKKTKRFNSEKNYADAIAICSRGLKLYPIVTGLYYERAMAYFHLENYASAELNLCIAIWLGQGSDTGNIISSYYGLLRKLFIEQVNIPAAISASGSMYDLAADKTGLIEKIRSELSDELLQKGKKEFNRFNYDLALQLLEHAVSFNYKNSSVHFYLGVTYRELGNRLKAKQSFRRAHYLKHLKETTESKEPAPAKRLAETPTSPSKKLHKKNKPATKLVTPPLHKINSYNVEAYREANSAFNSELELIEIDKQIFTTHTEHEKKQAARKLQTKIKAKRKAELIRQRRLAGKTEKPYSSTSQTEEKSFTAQSAQKLSALFSYVNYSIWKSTPTLFDLPPEALEIFEMLNPNDAAFLVGGAVRDSLLGMENITDYDFVTQVTGEHLQTIFADMDIYQLKHIPSVYKISVDEAYTADMKVSDIPCGTYEDALERDFTVNAIFVDREGNIRDPLNRGLQDLQNKMLCTIKPADISFENDPIRILRGLYISTKCNLTLHDDIKTAISSKKHLLLQKVAPGQLNFFIKKLLTGSKATENFKRLLHFGIIDCLFPTIADQLKSAKDWILTELEATSKCEFPSLPHLYTSWIAAGIKEAKNPDTINNIIKTSSLFEASLTGRKELGALLRSALDRWEANAAEVKPTTTSLFGFTL